jgi:phage portal protein BeeE
LKPVEQLLNRFGLIPKQKFEQLERITATHILSDLSAAPPELRDRISQGFTDLKRLDIVADSNRYYKKHIEVANLLQTARTYTKEGGAVDVAVKRMMMRGGNGNVFGYTPASAKMWNHFANPMEVFSFLYDNWWAFKVSVDLIETEVESGGFVLKAAKGRSEERILSVYKQLKELELDTQFVQGVVHSVKYGNHYLLPHTSLANKEMLVKLETLAPNRLIPIFDTRTGKVIGHEYWEGSVKRTFSVEQLIHTHLSSGQEIQIGTPPILPAVLDIEAALYASMLNNTIFQKGGILGAILALEEPKSDDGISMQQSKDWIELIQEKINAEAGARGGHGMMVIPGKAELHKLADPGSIDSNWNHGKDFAAKITAELCGVPPEKLGLVRSSALQYSPALVEDSVNAQLDATINRLTRKFATVFNREILEKRLGIYDVKIQPIRRTGAKTKTATEALSNLANGGWITRNEGRVGWLDMEALPGKEGDELVDTSINRNPDSLPPVVPQQNPDPDFASLDEGKRSKTPRSGEGFYTINVGGADDGFIEKHFK